jgi:hypothetical protein
MPHTNPSVTKHRHQAQKLPPVAGGNLLSKHKVLGFVGYLAAVLVLILVTRGEDRSPTPENSQQEKYLRILSPDFWYEHAVGEPEHPADYVSVIMVGKEMPRRIGEGTVSGPNEIAPACKRRIYIAELLKALSSFAPKVVVLDMWFDPEACSVADSQALWDELDQFSTQVPVVSGLGAYNHSEIQWAWPAEFADVSNRKPGLSPTELVLKPRTCPIHADNASITEGVVTLNSDNRKIALGWPAYDSFVTVGEPGQPRRIDSLSIAGVRAYDPKGAILKKVDALAPDGSAKVSSELHPYTSFLREENLPITRAIDVICSAPNDDSWRSECGKIKRLSLDPKKMFGRKIVLVGLTGVSDDVHQSLVGNVPGVILQANYIESLLQNRIYKPLPKKWQIVTGIGWLAVVFWVSWRFARHPLLALFFSLIAVIIPAYLIRLFILHFHYYADLLVPLILAAFVLNFTRWIERFLTHGEETL